MMQTLEASPSFTSRGGASLQQALRGLRPFRRQILIGLVLLIAINLWLWGLGRNAVIDSAYSMPVGQGYCALDEYGVGETIKHNGSVILAGSDSGGSYCCGFTFAVAMQVAEDRGLLKDKTVAEIRQFQQTWYGTTKETARRQCAMAVEELGIGREIPFDEAQPGDFIAYTRKSGMGHSVVFLGWMTDKDGNKIGIHYRSSQPSTDGVGNQYEFFAGTGVGPESSGIDRDYLVVARLDRRWWSHLCYPFSP